MPGLQLLIDIDDKGTPKVTKFEGRWNRMKNRVLGGTSSIAKAWDRARRSWGALERRVQRGATLLKYALLAIGTAAIVIGANFEQSMAKVSSVAGGSAADLKELSLTARAWGERTAYSASQAADAMYALASAGQTTGEIIKSVGGVLLFAGAGATSMGEAAEIVVQTLKQFGLQAEETGRVINVLAAGISSSMLTADRLKESLAQVGATAASLNMDVEETVGQLGLLHNAGMLGGVAGTRLKNVLVRLAAPSAAMKRILGDVTLETHGLAGVMEHLAKRGTTAGEVYAAFGRIAGPAALTFMRAGRDEMERMTKAVTGTTKAQEMYDKQQDTTIGDFKRFKSAVEENFIAAFEAVKPSIRSALQTLTAWAKRGRTTLVGLVATIRDFVARNKETLIIMAKVIGIFAGVIAAIVMWKAIVIGAVLAAIFYIVKYRDEVWDAFKSIGRGFQQIGEAVAKLGAWIWDKIKWPFVKIAELAQKAAGIFKRVFPDAAEAVEGVLEVVKEKGGEAFDFVIDIDKGTEGIKRMTREVAGVGGAFKQGAEAVREFWKTAQETGKAEVAALPDVSTEFGGRRIKKRPVAVSPMPGLPPQLYADIDDYFKAWDQGVKKLHERRLAADLKAADEERAIVLQTVAYKSAHEKEWLDARLALAEANMQETLGKSELTASQVAEAQIKYDQEVAAAKMEHQDAVLEHWMAMHEVELMGLEALGAAYDTYFATVLDKEMSWKKRREAMWDSMRRSFISNWAAMVKYYITSWLKALAVKDAAEQAQSTRTRVRDAKEGAVAAYHAFAAIPFVGPALGATAAAAAFGFLMAFHKGGLVGSDSRREVVGLLEEGEHITRRSSVTPETLPVLRQINATGKVPSTGDINIPISINAEGSGEVDINEILYKIEDQIVPALEDLNARRRLKLKRRVA